MDKSTYRFTLDLRKHLSQMVINVFQHDTAVRLCISLTDGGKPYGIGEGCIAHFFGKRADGVPLVHECMFNDTFTEIIYDFEKTTAPVVGIVDCQIRLYGADSQLISAPKFTIVVDERVVNDEEIEIDGESPISALDRLLTLTAKITRAHFRYSEYEDGTDFTTDWNPGQNYIGIATKAEAPTEKEEYTWCRFVGNSGTDGKDGANGVDGVTPTFKLENDKLSVSYNNGETWTSLGTIQGGGGSGGDCQLSTEEANYLKQLYTKAQIDAITGELIIEPNTGIYEMGQSTQTVTISWSFTKEPTTIEFKINNSEKSISEDGYYDHKIDLTEQGSYKYDMYAEFKHKVTDDKPYKTLNLTPKTIGVYNRYYRGCAEEPSEPSSIDSSFITSLTKGWASTPEFSETSVNCQTNQYIWYAYPKRLGEANMYMDRYEGGFDPPIIVSVTNTSKYTEDYYVYRSTNKSLGSTLIEAR